jgi:uncharacterized protein YndB with AHSA1/START domain
MSTAASGRREVREGTDYIVLTRTFRAPIQDVWAAVTEPQRLERWIGTWTGDPESGEVTFRMTAEGEDVEPETYRIEVCDPPRRLRTNSLTQGPEGQEWLLDLQLSEDDGTTTLTFARAEADYFPAMAEHYRALFDGQRPG